MRQPLTISVEEEDVKVLRHLCDLMGISMSQLFRDTVRGYVMTAKAARLMEKKKMSKLDVVRFFGKGLAADPIE